MKIFYTGDSTCAQYNITTFPQTGMGQGLELFVKKEIKIHNHAVNGRSTKSFIDQGRLDVIEREIHAGDFLLIQFGHNDEKESDKSYAIRNNCNSKCAGGAGKRHHMGRRDPR